MKKYIKCLMITLGVGVLLILIKNQFSPVLLKGANYGMPALTESGEVDNLYIGSSMFRQGIDIMTLEDNGERNYVLSYNGNQPVLEYYQLEKLLQSNIQIKNLYIDIYAYSAWAEPKISDEKMLMEFGLKDKWYLYKLISHGTTIENAKTFWQMFVSGNNELIATWIFSSKMINGMFYKGGSMNRPSASNQSKLDALGVPEIAGHMNAVQREYSLKMISLAKEKGIHLTYIESPKYYRMSDDDGYISAMKQYIEFLDEENVKYILCDSTWNATGQNKNARMYSFDNGKSDYFVDNGHLSYAGRIEFTRQIVNLK